MYKKNLSERVVLRLSPSDLNFLSSLATQRNVSVSQVIRDIIFTYKSAGGVVHGYTKTDIYNQL